MTPQQTVAGQASCAGQALHSGDRVSMTLLPAPPESGLIFRRLDLPGRPSVRAAVETVVDTRRCLSIGSDDWRIGTIEHFLAAAHGLGLDNALVELDGPELPAGDGSALFFTNLIRQAGLAPQERPRRYRVAAEPVWVEENGSYLVLLPPECPGLTVSYTFSADERAIGAHYRRFRLGIDDFTGEIAPARTIAFIEEIEALRREGLAQSNDTELVVVVGPEGYLNERRFPDEVVRHKILDLMGDLFLLGPLHGQLIAIRSGHRLNHRLAQELARTIPALTLGEDGATEGLVL